MPELKLKEKREKVDYREIFTTPESRKVLLSAIKKFVFVTDKYEDPKPFFFGYIDYLASIASKKELKSLKKTELTHDEYESIITYQLFVCGINEVASIFREIKNYMPEWKENECIKSYFDRVRIEMQIKGRC